MDRAAHERGRRVDRVRVAQVGAVKPDALELRVA